MSNSPDSQKALQVPHTPPRQSSGMLIRDRQDASATVWSSRQVMKRVTPSSNADRKSTRLNSSHANISYAVFRLTKKKSLSLSRLDYLLKFHVLLVMPSLGQRST